MFLHIHRKHICAWGMHPPDTLIWLGVQKHLNYANHITPHLQRKVAGPKFLWLFPLGDKDGCRICPHWLAVVGFYHNWQWIHMCSDQVLDLHNCTIVCSLCILNQHPPVSCLPSPQLTLPEGTQPRWGHTLTAFEMDQGRIHATTFGGCSRYVYGEPDDDRPKLADTTVLEFGEQNTYHTTLHWVACSLTVS